ncbi:hypothetical protein H6P81_012622 [Aristolochia fimbriata]|uniref:VTT domain-containing protein n=1 Tax=Aristolochia fimbriata TaxID=158543 RepID=A0AAV7ECQ0_ARIFI|nr:hypothetical protein H6P81_012622 [Aristolochia fimbriata]
MAVTALLCGVPLGPFPALQKARNVSGHRITLFSKQLSVIGLASARSFLGYSNFRVINLQPRDAGIARASTSGNSSSYEEDGHDTKPETSSQKTSLLAKLAIALGFAATASVISLFFKKPFVGSTAGLPFLTDGSTHSIALASTNGFTLTIFKYKIILPQYTPGWIYFWLLMAAGCGLFISEEALNIWVGTSLARMLTLDGTWSSFAKSFSKNSPFIISTVLWVYWGVCISDMIPFYLGKAFRKTKTSEDVCSKLGIGKEKALSITQAVQKYGNLIGFVERFSIGVRNPTAFLAGMLGISAECFFAGVCLGGLVTLPVQLVIGFLLRERPLMAVAGVATVVGIWTVFPYILGISTALFLYLRQRSSV